MWSYDTKTGATSSSWGSAVFLVCPMEWSCQPAPSVLVSNFLGVENASLAKSASLFLWGRYVVQTAYQVYVVYVLWALDKAVPRTIDITVTNTIRTKAHY